MAITIDFSGRVALITGGTKGAGRGIAQRFSEAGATVVVCARQIPDDLPTGWVGHAVDLREPDAAAGLIDAVAAQFGRIDYLVNNAGGAPSAVTGTAKPSFTQKIVALNLLAPMWCSEAANQHMQRQADGGAIVNIGSVSAERPAPMAAAYGAAKAGLLNYTKTTGMEWLPKVRVNMVSSGLIKTEIAEQWYGDPESIAHIEAQIPAGRMALPSDIGDACVLLCSPLASYISGAILHAHGGGETPPFLS